MAPAPGPAWFTFDRSLGCPDAIARPARPVPVGVEKHQHGRPRLLRATPETVFETDDTIFLIGAEEQARQLVAAQDLVVLPPFDQRQRHEAFQQLGIAEIMLAPESHLVGQTLREAEFESRHRLSVLAIRHRGEPVTTNLGDQPLDFGDTLLVAGGWAEIGRLRDDRENFFVLTLPAEFGELMPARRRAPVAVGILVAMVVLMALEVIPNAAAVLLAALALIASGCVKLDAIYRIINWKTVILVAGTLPLATALAKTGATAMMANGMVAALGSLGPLAVLATLFLVTSLVGLFISNSATAVLMAPIAIEAARALHDSPGVRNDSRARLLRRLCDAGIVRREHAGHGAGRLLLWRLCQARRAAAAVDYGRHRRAG
jgi:di/tricarboxylate transporter